MSDGVDGDVGAIMARDFRFAPDEEAALLSLGVDATKDERLRSLDGALEDAEWR